MDERHIKTEYDYELKRFNKETAVKKLNEKFEYDIALITLEPFTTSTDVLMAPMPNPAIADIQVEHIKALAQYAKEKGYNLVHEHYTKELEKNNSL